MIAGSGGGSDSDDRPGGVYSTSSGGASLDRVGEGLQDELVGGDGGEVGGDAPVLGDRYRSGGGVCIHDTLARPAREVKAVVGSCPDTRQLPVVVGAGSSDGTAPVRVNRKLVCDGKEIRG